MARLGTFMDIKPILDQALATGGGSLTFETHGKAVNWRHRAYAFRKAYAAQLRSGEVSPYDRLSFPKLAPDSRVVRITTHRTDAIFQPDPNGVPIAPAPDDDLLEFAKRMASGLDEDVI